MQCSLEISASVESNTILDLSADLPNLNCSPFLISKTTPTYYPDTPIILPVYLSGDNDTVPP